MRGVFHGWKRKLGVVVLLFACGLTAVWVRGLRIRSEIALAWTDKTATPYVTSFNTEKGGPKDRDPTTKTLHQLISTNGIEWRRLEVTNPDSRIRYPNGWSDTTYDAFVNLDDYLWRSRFLGFDVGSRRKGNSSENVIIQGGTRDSMRRSDPRLLMNYWTVPYWAIVFPLCVTAAWLLLSKRNKSNPKSKALPEA